MKERRKQAKRARWLKGVRGHINLDWVREPRVVSFLAWLMYLVLFVVGSYTLYDPPLTLEAAMGGYAAVVVAGMVSIGGLLGAVGALPGWRVVERLGIASLLGGSSIYLCLTAVLHITGDGNRLFQSGFLAVVIISLISRLVRIHGRVFEPGSRASRRAIAKHPEVRPDTGSTRVIEEGVTLECESIVIEVKE